MNYKAIILYGRLLLILNEDMPIMTLDTSDELNYVYVTHG